MKRVIVPIGYVLAVLLGFALLSYPIISNYLYEQRQDGVIERYETLAQDTALDETRKKALEAARKYNRQLASGVVSLEDPFLTATTPEKDGTQSSILDIAGHRGYRGIPYFRYLDDLEEGDLVYLTNFWGTMTYTVMETAVIQPDDIDAILIQNGRDMLTLLTCHPYTVGTQRLLIYCERGA